MHVLVTGAARGIGAAVVECLMAAGHTITACDIDLDGLAQRWGERAGAAYRALDVTDVAAWSAAVEEAWNRQPVDVLINVAGVLRAGEVGELLAPDVQAQVAVNVFGVIHGSNATAARMRERGSGHIINVGSTASVFATPGNGVYAATKHAVRGFSIAAAGDLRPHGVDVSLVCPSAVKTGMLEQQRGDWRAALTFEGARALSPEEVAQAIVGEVMVNKPLEYYLPAADQWKGRLCTAFPNFFLSNVEKARQKGISHFDSPEH